MLITTGQRCSGYKLVFEVCPNIDGILDLAVLSALQILLDNLCFIK